MQFYCNRDREQDPHALPDAETFELRFSTGGGEDRHSYHPDDFQDDAGNSLEPGWYWHACFPACFPGCLPDGPPFGAFDTEELAIADARESVGAAQNPSKCETCQDAEHDTCPLVDGCSCCTNTRQEMLSF